MQYLITWFLIAVRQEVKRIDNSVVVHALELAIKNDLYEGQSKITEPYLITFELSNMDIYLDDISLKLYVIYLIT